MGAFKIIWTVLLLVILIACGDKNTADMDVEELRRECDMLRKDRAKTLENNVEAQELIDNIFASVNSLSGRTANLQRSVGEGSLSESRLKAEEIAQDIEIIKEKLERAGEQGSLDNSTKIIISKLKTTIAQKQQEVDELRDIIRRKDEQISHLGQQVTTLDNELGAANLSLRESNAELASTKEKLRETEINSWISMGDELIRAAQTLPHVKGHGNMKPIKIAKLTIILKARNCYQNAASLGGASASARISMADRIYMQNR